MKILKAGAAYFGLVFGAGFLLGCIRVPFLVRRFSLPLDTAIRLGVGFVALGLAIAAEFLLALVLAERSVAEYLASRDPVSGSVYLVMLLVFALLPLILARIKLLWPNLN